MWSEGECGLNRLIKNLKNPHTRGDFFITGYLVCVASTCGMLKNEFPQQPANKDRNPRNESKYHDDLILAPAIF